MKRCKDCDETKPLDEFYVHKVMADGRLNKCKACVRARVKKHRAENVERIREYDRERHQRPERRAYSKAQSKRWYAENPERAAELARRWQAANPERSGEVRRRWKLANPVKIAAHVAVNNAVRAGKLAKQPCVVCGETQVHAHHHDYSKPLDVEWLCPLHHRRLHTDL
jgi:hypothetical protein